MKTGTCSETLSFKATGDGSGIEITLDTTNGYDTMRIASWNYEQRDDSVPRFREETLKGICEFFLSEKVTAWMEGAS
jgi:hypothetical protein